MNENKPFVSIVTPVFNGEQYLSECIESVISQVYTNWEYIIVNNCSTDSTFDIANTYARKDKRIRLITNEKFVDIIENHNNAFNAISQNSKYCKVVSADDWIYPECIQKMVEEAEKYPSVGIVAGYAISNVGLRVIDLPLQTNFIRGHEAGRNQLLGLALFKAPSALLYRADLVRALPLFFAGTALNADMDAFFRDMQHYDYACVHQILCFERVHDNGTTHKLSKYNSLLVDRLEFIARYGSIYLTQVEFDNRNKILQDEYYEYLADRIIHFSGRKFWDYQKNRLIKFGCYIDKVKLCTAIITKISDLVLNPKQSLQKVLRRL